MDKPLQLSVRNSDLKITKDKRAFLTYPADGLANCSLEELEDGIRLTFDTDGLAKPEDVFSKNSNSGAGKSREQQLRFMINCADLEELYCEYDFSLSTDNMLVDINLRPQVLMRDVRNGNRKDFLSKYMALIGSFLLRKYNYDDFEKGGDDLFKKNKLLLELSEMEDVASIKNQLIKEYHKRVEKVAQTKKLVPKRNTVMVRVTIPILTLLLLAAGFFAGMALLFDIPYRNQVIMANEAYIAGNPLEVQRAMSGFPVQNLTHETRHILSRSYVATEPISDAQRNNILMGLTLITDGSIFDYWIHLGRLEFYEAIDIALRFGDNELLLFAYIRQEAIVRADPHMPGTEKVALLSYIENRIDALQRDRESAEGLIVDAVDEVTGADGDFDYDEYPHNVGYYDYEYDNDSYQDGADEDTYNQGEYDEESDSD